MPYGYVYFTENLISGRCYIGQHKAKKFDKRYKGSGKYLKPAIEKYGKENFVCQIIQWCDSAEELNEAEKYWIAKCNAVESHLFYNVSPGGNVNSGEANGMFGKHAWSYGLKGVITFSDEHIKNLSESHLGQYVLPETKAKKSVKMKQFYINNPEARDKLANRPDMYDHEVQSERAKKGWLTRKLKMEVK